jgi:hypothetical protein
MAIEIVSFPIKNGESFHSYVKLPEGIYLVLKKHAEDWQIIYQIAEKYVYN